MAASASFAGDDPAAYAFPQLISALMLIFCGANLIRRSLARFAGEPVLTMQLARKIAPGGAVIVVYVLFAEDVGFYLSAILAFFALSFLYGEHRRLSSIGIATGARRRCPVPDVLRGVEGAGAEGVFPVTVFYPTKRREVS